MPPLLERAAVVPAVSQIEVHPYFTQQAGFVGLMTNGISVPVGEL